MNFRIKASAEAGFHRCGEFFPHTGRVFAESVFTPEQWERLKNEPALHISETEDAPTSGDEPEVDADHDLKLALAHKVAELAAQDFQKDGKPKLEALRKALPEVKADITADLRDVVWDSLLEGGFDAPVESAPAD